MILAWRCDPLLTALFTPFRPEMGRYEVCTTGERLDEVVAAGRAEGLRYGPVEALEALDAFGSAGPYDRFAVTRLYRGTRARVVRGWRIAGDRFESVTLVSPFPDASLTHLLDGTLRIVFTLSHARPEGRARPPNMSIGATLQTDAMFRDRSRLVHLD
jgi:hypothetical protein